MLLLDAGAIPSPGDLLLCSRMSDLLPSASLTLLLDRCEQIDERSGYGVTPLMEACRRIHVWFACALLERGANAHAVDADGWNGMIYLVRSPCTDADSPRQIGARLIDGGLSPHGECYHGISALSHASSMARMDLAGWLAARYQQHLLEDGTFAPCAKPGMGVRL
jgi:hypothetical protein